MRSSLFILPLFIHFLWFLLISSAKSTHFDYPKGGFERADPINPQLFFPCLKPIFDPEYGTFDPLVFPNYPVSFPPIAACPEVVNKNTVRFFAISRRNPTRISSLKEIGKGSKISFFIHGYIEEYDSPEPIGSAMTLLKSNDWVVLVDWARLANTRVFDRIRIPFVNAYLSLTNPILVGRITCKCVKFLLDKHGIQIEDILLVGLSGGAQTLGFLADYCRERYEIRFNHMVGKLLLILEHFSK